MEVDGLVQSSKPTLIPGHRQLTILRLCTFLPLRPRYLNQYFFVSCVVYLWKRRKTVTYWHFTEVSIVTNNVSIVGQTAPNTTQHYEAMTLSLERGDNIDNLQAKSRRNSVSYPREYLNEYYKGITPQKGATPLVNRN